MPWDFLDFPWKGHFPASGVFETLANSGGHYSIYVSDVRGIAAPWPAIDGFAMRSRWPTRIRKWQLCFEQYRIYHPFFNTYYHKQINKILIAAFNETFRHSSDPLYAHTPMRNVGELRTFKSKLRTSPEAKSKIVRIRCQVTLLDLTNVAGNVLYHKSISIGVAILTTLIDCLCCLRHWLVMALK